MKTDDPGIQHDRGCISANRDYKPCQWHLPCLLILPVVFIFIPYIARAQDPVQATDNRLQEEDLYLTTLDDITEEAIQADDVSAELEWLYDRPLTLDLQGFELLGEMGLLNAYKINKLKEYVYKYGPMLSIYETRYVEGLTADDITLLHSIFLNSHQPKKKGEEVLTGIEPGTSFPILSTGPSVQKLFWKPVRQSFTVRYGRQIERRPAYDNSEDPVPASAYLGSPGQIALKYDLSLGRRMKFGLRLEKDAGEALSLRKMEIGNRVINPGFDHLSAFLQWSANGPVKRIIIGDYQLRFGQGLNLWNGYGMSRPFQQAGILRTALPLKPNTGLAPFAFFRGAAIEAGGERTRIIVFFSRRMLDATTEPLPHDSSTIVAVSIRNTGYHRTLNELSFKKNLSETAYGGHLSFSHKFLKAGITGYRHHFGTTVDLSATGYKHFQFNGNTNFILGGDLVLAFKKWMIFSEISIRPGHGAAWLAGINISPVPDLHLALMAHQQSPDYFNFHQNHYASGSPGIPSLGIYTGLEWSPWPGIDLNAFADYTGYRWIRYSSRGLSSRISGGIQLVAEPSRNVMLRAGLRSGNRPVNVKPPFENVYELGEARSRSLDFRVHFLLSEKFELRYLAEMNIFIQANGDKNQGTMVAQELIYTPGLWFHSLFIRTVLFDTEGYDARVYSYERDVYGSASIPAYYDQGTRLVAMLRFNLFKSISLWLRYGLYHYPGKTSIGSGVNEIRGNIKSELRIQVRVKV